MLRVPLVRNFLAFASHAAGSFAAQLTRGNTAAFLIAAAAAAAPAVAADTPLCAPPAPGETFRTSCRTWETGIVVQLLDELTVDHLFKPELPAFERTWQQIVAPFTSKNLVEGEPFRRLVQGLEPLRFTQLDRTTGTVSASLASAPREADVDALAFGETVRLHVRFPEALDGGYWRGPDTLQVAFWEKFRLGLRVSRGSDVIAEGDVACIALSPDGLMVRFAEKGAVPFFLRIRDCEGK